MWRAALTLPLAAALATATASAQEITINAAAPEFRIIDGDSIDYGYLHFRLCGIQAPERDAPYYKLAGDMLAELSGDGLIAARIVDIDKYNRQIAVLRRLDDALTINEQMVLQGGAKHYTRFSKNCEPYINRDNFKKAQRKAKNGGLGIWE